MAGIGTRIRETVRGWIDRFRPGTRVEEEPAPARRCAICRTIVPVEDDRCPLCGGTDIRQGDEHQDDGEPAPPPESRSEGTDDTVAKLSALRTNPDDRLLVAYADRYSGLADGKSKYQVTLADGSTTAVADQQELRATLLREYGPPTLDDGGQHPD